MKKTTTNRGMTALEFMAQSFHSSAVTEPDMQIRVGDRCTYEQWNPQTQQFDAKIGEWDGQQYKEVAQ